MENNYRGELIANIEPTDEGIRSKRLMLKLDPLFTIGFTIMLIIIFILFEMPLDWVIIVMIAWVILSIITFIIYKRMVLSYIAPILIYSNGVESFSSEIDRIRGLDGFISVDKISKIQTSLDPQSRFTDPDIKIGIISQDGKTRILGIRSLRIAENAVNIMSRQWGIPVKHKGKPIAGLNIDGPFGI